MIMSKGDIQWEGEGCWKGEMDCLKAYSPFYNRLIRDGDMFSCLHGISGDLCCHIRKTLPVQRHPRSRTAMGDKQPKEEHKLLTQDQHL